MYSDVMSTLVQPAATEPLPCYEEVRQLRRMIRQWESVAETLVELIRNLRTTLGLDPDVNDEEEPL